ncbi:MAG: PaaI family thioesterase [Actinomycetota bacterium]|nr:PaaI family thioesterase [Actinomycetota bacterium]
MRDLSGLEYLGAVVAGELPPPPMAAVMGFTGVEVGKGRALFRGQPGEEHVNPNGAVHGSFGATLLDSALECAVHTTLPARVDYTTVDLNVTFVGRITPDTGPVPCEGTGGARGADDRHDAGAADAGEGWRVLAHGTATCLILRGEGERGRVAERGVLPAWAWLWRARGWSGRVGASGG